MPKTASLAWRAAAFTPRLVKGLERLGIGAARGLRCGGGQQQANALPQTRHIVAAQRAQSACRDSVIDGYARGGFATAVAFRAWKDNGTPDDFAPRWDDAARDIRALAAPAETDLIAAQPKGAAMLANLDARAVENARRIRDAASD